MPHAFLEDVHAIEQVYVRYCELVDAKLFDLLGDGSSCGATHLNVGNFRIRVDGDRARARVNDYAVHRGVGRHDGALYSMWGLYDDELVRTAAGWRVHRRIYSSILTEGPAVTSRD